MFLPKLTNGEPLYVGFFHTGAYQDQISGYGGIKHCLIPSPKHIIVEHDKNGKLVDWVYAKEQTAQSMLKILGYENNKKNLPIRRFFYRVNSYYLLS